MMKSKLQCPVCGGKFNIIRYVLHDANNRITGKKVDVLICLKCRAMYIKEVE